MSAPAGPIADLSYRNYDGPKSIARFRWWPIARNGIRIALRKKFFWVLVALAALPYLFTILQMIFLSRASEMGTRIREMPNLLEMIGQAFTSRSGVLFVALLVGTGAIAADNRANALQVYLARPLTKLDYLIGKLLSVFLPVYAVTFVPLFLTVLYAGLDMGFGSFLSEYPWLLPSTLLLAALPALVHSCVLCGLSAWNKTPWVVGVIYVGVVFFWNNIAVVVSIIMRHGLSRAEQTTVANLSLEGAINGLAYRILGEMPRQFSFGRRAPELPYATPLIILLLIFIVLGVYLCYARIRAVEVVKG